MPAWWLTDYDFSAKKLTDICVQLDMLIQGVQGSYPFQWPVPAAQADHMLEMIILDIDEVIGAYWDKLSELEAKLASWKKLSPMGYLALQMQINYTKSQLELAKNIKGELLMSFSYHHLIETGDMEEPYTMVEATPEERLEMVKKLKQVQVMAGCVPGKVPAELPEKPVRRPLVPVILALILLLVLGTGGIILAIQNDLNATVDDPGSQVVLPKITLTPKPQDKTNSSNVQIVLTDEATDEPTEESCKETGRYCSCAGVAYQIITCADGNRTDTPTGNCTPDPAQCGSAANTNDPCANNGGLQFSGQSCTCQGQVDLIIICNDGTKTDTITTEQCTPNAAQCTGSDQAGGGSCPCACVTSCPGISCIMVCRDCKGNSCTP